MGLNMTALKVNFLVDVNMSVSMFVILIDWLPLPSKSGLQPHVNPGQDKNLENDLTETGTSLFWAFVLLFGLITLICLSMFMLTQSYEEFFFMLQS